MDSDDDDLEGGRMLTLALMAVVCFGFGYAVRAAFGYMGWV